jgi:hypothetical protein
MKIYEQYINEVVKRYQNPKKGKKKELITHSILGLSSEIGELIEGQMMGDNENIREELGDLCYFFWQGVDAIGFDPFDVDLEYSLKDSSNMGINKMIVSSSILVDLLKGHLFYDKPFPKDEELKLHYARFYFNFKYLLNENNYNEAEIMQVNGKKLFARYGEKFSEEKATKRNLKKEKKALK